MGKDGAIQEGFECWAILILGCFLYDYFIVLIVATNILFCLLFIGALFVNHHPRPSMKGERQANN